MMGDITYEMDRSFLSVSTDSVTAQEMWLHKSFLSSSSSVVSICVDGG